MGDFIQLSNWIKTLNCFFVACLPAGRAGARIAVVIKNMDEEEKKKELSFSERMRLEADIRRIRFLRRTRMILIEKFKQQRLRHIRIINWFLSQLLKNSDSKGCEELRNMLRWWDREIWWVDYSRKNKYRPKLLGPAQTKNQEQFQEIKYGPEEVEKIKMFVKKGFIQAQLKKQAETGKELTFEESLREIYEEFSQEEKLVYESNKRRTAPRKVEKLKRIKDFKQKILDKLDEMKEN